MLGIKPHSKPVSWMVPVSQAMANGGFQAARDCYESLKSNSSQKYYCDEDSLISLALQIRMAEKPHMALDVLELNKLVYPDHVETHLQMARLYQAAGETERSMQSIFKILSLEPANPAGHKLLERFGAAARARSMRYPPESR